MSQKDMCLPKVEKPSKIFLGQKDFLDFLSYMINYYQASVM